MNTTGATDAEGGDAVARQAFGVFFDTVGRLVGHGVTLVAEAAFQHRLWAPQLEPLLATADVRIVVCHVDAATARGRRADRFRADPDRERFHADPGVLAPPGLEGYDPPLLPVPTLTIDTVDGYAPGFDAIVAFATVGVD